MYTWYRAMSLDGVYQELLDGDYFKTYNSPQEVKEALERRANESHKEREPFAICKETYKKTLDEYGRIVRIEKIIEAVEYYITQGRTV